MNTFDSANEIGEAVSNSNSSFINFGGEKTGEFASNNHLGTDSVLSIRRLLTPTLYPFSSALELQCKIQHPQAATEPDDTQSFKKMSRRQIKLQTISARHRKTSSKSVKSLGSVEKRNERERTRVHTVNQAFHALKSNLPLLKMSQKRVSKLKILKTAIDYIYTLSDKLDDIVKQSNFNSIISPIPSSYASQIPGANDNLFPQNLPNASASDLLSLSSYMNYQNIASYVSSTFSS